MDYPSGPRAWIPLGSEPLSLRRNENQKTPRQPTIIYGDQICGGGRRRTYG